jgi:hypothetical protein
MGIENLAMEAQTVVLGTVVRMESRFDSRSDYKRIVTDVSIKVNRVIAGEPREAVVVTVLGGEVGNQGQLVPGAPRFKVGEEVVLFLRRFRDLPDRFSIVGFTEGVFRVEREGARVRLRQSLQGVMFQDGTLGEAREMEFYLEDLEEKVRKIKAEVLKR